MAIADLFIGRLRDQLAVQGLGLELSAGAQALPRREGLRPRARRAPAAPRGPDVRRGRAEREDPVQGVPRRPDHRRRRGRRSRRDAPHLRGRRGPAAVGRLRGPHAPARRSQPLRSVAGVKARPSHVCSACGAIAPRWSGRCPGCGEWNTLAVARAAAAPPPVDAAAPTSLRAAAAPVPTGVGELDRVLGGGLVAGSTTLLFGEPGRRQVDPRPDGAGRALGRRATPSCWSPPRSPPAQVARARRAPRRRCPTGLDVAATADVAATESLIRERRPRLCVVDSVSAMSADRSLARAGRLGAPGAPRRRAAVRRGARRGHRAHADRPRDQGRRAGRAARPRAPRRHRRAHRGRPPRAAAHAPGAQAPVRPDRRGRTGRDGRRTACATSPTRPRLCGEALDVPGVVVGVALDGSRATRVEVQALVAAAAGPPRRVAHQVSAQRLSLLLGGPGRALRGGDGRARRVRRDGRRTAGRPSRGSTRPLALAVASAAMGFTVAPHPGRGRRGRPGRGAAPGGRARAPGPRGAAPGRDGGAGAGRGRRRRGVRGAPGALPVPRRGRRGGEVSHELAVFW